MSYIASLAVPICLCAVGLILAFRDKYFDAFLEGAKRGLKITMDLLPTLVALLTCISMFSASGALDYLVRLVSPVTSALGIPPEILPLVIMRPVSGSGSIALVSDLFTRHGADSYAGRAASILLGSTDTVFYIFAVYFAAAKVKRTRYALLIALIVQLFALLLSCRLALLIS